jgi:hypothetical protein
MSESTQISADGTAGDAPGRPDIAATVATAGDKKASPAARVDAYDKAMSYFLDDANDVEKIPVEEDVDIKRMVDGDEQVIMTLRVRNITEQELTRARQMSKEKTPGVRAEEQETDQIRFYTLLAAAATVKPNLKDPRLVDRFVTPEGVLRNRLLPGERMALGLFIMDRSGFGQSVSSAAQAQKEMEAAKN